MLSRGSKNDFFFCENPRYRKESAIIKTRTLLESARKMRNYTIE